MNLPPGFHLIEEGRNSSQGTTPPALPPGFQLVEEPVSQQQPRDAPTTAGRQAQAAPRHRPNNFVQQIMSSMPFADEAEGLGAAAAGYILQGIEGVFGTDITPNTDPQDVTYARGQAESLAARDQYAEQNPVKSGLATGIGALASVGRGGAAAPVGLGATIKEGMKQGGVLGGLYGAGEGDNIADRAVNAAWGAIEGAGLGAAVPVAVAGGGAAVKGIKTALSPATTAFTNRITPDARATKIAAQAFQRDGVPIDQAAQRIGAMRKTSPETVLADAGGENVRGLARATVNTPGAGRERVAAFMEARRLDQPDRIVQSIRNVLANPDDFAKTTARMAAERESIAGPIYRAAFSRSVPVNVSNVVQAIDRRVAPGVQSLTGPTDLKADGVAATLRNIRSYFATKMNQRTDLKELHGIKIELDDMIGAAKAGNEGGKAAALQEVKRELLRAMDRASPDYKKARGIFSSSHEMDEALDLGRNVFRMDAQALKAELARLDTPAQREMVQVGIARSIEDMAAQTRDGHDLVRKMFGNKKSRDVLRAGFQDDKAFRRFQVTMMREAAMRGTDDAIRGNSTTAKQLADLMETHQGGVGRDVVSLLMDGKFGQAAAATVRQAIMGEQGISAKVADSLSKLLLSNDPAKIQRAMTALARKERALTRVKQALTNSGRRGGQVVTREVIASQSSPTEANR